jgi:hypothetical protein
MTYGSLAMKQTTFRGKAITDEDIIREMKRFDAENREKFNNWGTYAVKRDGILYPPKELLSMTTGINVDEFNGGEYTNCRFRNLDFDVITIGTIPETDEEVEEAVETSLSLERDLENFLVADLTQIEPGLQLFQENEKSGKQLNAGDAGRIDVLCVDQSRNLVVLELKAGEADDKVATQILRYMGWISENIADGRDVRGIIVANEFTDKLKYAVKPVPAITLKKYEISFRFVNMSSFVGLKA